MAMTLRKLMRSNVSLDISICHVWDHSDATITLLNDVNCTKDRNRIQLLVCTERKRTEEGYFDTDGNSVEIVRDKKSLGVKYSYFSFVKRIPILTLSQCTWADVLQKSSGNSSSELHNILPAHASSRNLYKKQSQEDNKDEAEFGMYCIQQWISKWEKLTYKQKLKVNRSQNTKSSTWSSSG
ncbi:hypothetical protein IGI04_015016 [Brassica rapa subsp. trilocularis]|uniref:Uncharacterized protein n=1 Tax=Brassica rapa subsp. trilocularis TaxID=1813537 RepID=A0ABQ7MSA1_BRACM|nr:hypothetical protein IGI04_015016 [Brassica rapa subsp. trilocularis]